MSTHENENFVGLARSPAIKRTPRGYTPTPAEDGGLSGATTARMSTEGSTRSIGSSASATGEDRRRHSILQPLARNSMFDNSSYSNGSAAHTPCAASPLDKMTLAISSKKKAVATARRSHLPVSRTLKLSPAADNTRQHQQESVMTEPRTAAEGGGSSTPYPEAADHTQYSITQSALLSTLGRLPPTPHGDASSSNQGKNSSPRSGSLNYTYRDQPATPPAALGETDFLGGGDISNIDEGLDEGRSGAWSDGSFADAILPEEGHSPAAEIAMRATSSVNITNALPSSATAASACTPGAVSALLRMGGHSVGTAPTPDSRYRGYVARSPLATSGTPGEECDEDGRGADVPNTPAAAAALTAMMMGTNGSVRGFETGTASVEEEEEVRSFAGEDATEDDDEKSAPPTGVQVHQPKQSMPETPSRRDNIGARLPIITPRRRKAASQLLDLSKATPKKLIRGILGGWNGPPVHDGKQREQYTRFVPQVAKVVENAEEETPRTLLKGVCAQESPPGFAAARTRCNSTSVAEAAAAAAAAAAASTAAAGAEDANVALPHPSAQPPRDASSPPATAVVVHSGLSAKGFGMGCLKIVMGLILLMLLAGGALIVAEDVAVVVCLAFAGPPLAQPIY